MSLSAEEIKLLWKRKKKSCTNECSRDLIDVPSEVSLHSLANILSCHWTRNHLPPFFFILLYCSHSKTQIYNFHHQGCVASNFFCLFSDNYNDYKAGIFILNCIFQCLKVIMFSGKVLCPGKKSYLFFFCSCIAFVIKPNVRVHGRVFLGEGHTRARVFREHVWVYQIHC